MPAEHRWDAEDKRVSQAMGDYWVRFARTGDPNGGPNAGGAVRWPAVTTQPTAYLAIGAKIHAATLLPIQEQAKAATMADSIRKWAAAKAP